MKETRESVKKFTLSWTQSIRHIFHAYGMKRVRAIFVTNFFFQSGLTFFATFFTVFLVSKFHMNQLGIGYYIGYAGIWIIVAQGVLLPYLSEKFEDVWLARFSLIAGSVAIFAYYLPHSLIGLGIVGALFALTNGISMATLPALASRRSPADIQGEILGINTSVQALAQAIPPILAGFLAANISPVAPVYISGGVIAVAWVVFMLFVQKEE
jgi:predicted MFS family arabinose efflux permease